MLNSDETKQTQECVVPPLQVVETLFGAYRPAGQDTHMDPFRLYPGEHAVQVVALVHVLQDDGQTKHSYKAK